MSVKGIWLNPFRTFSFSRIGLWPVKPFSCLAQSQLSSAPYAARLLLPSYTSYQHGRHVPQCKGAHTQFGCDAELVPLTGAAPGFVYFSCRLQQYTARPLTLVKAKQLAADQREPTHVDTVEHYRYLGLHTDNMLPVEDEPKPTLSPVRRLRSFNNNNNNSSRL
ncbi:uncharacterized protein V6R79_013574 [Siganus canaliculatus]